MSVRGINRDEFLPTGDEFAGGDPFSLIDRHSSFEGTFRSDRDLRIEGEVKGAIECQGTLFVADGASLSANIEAENVTVAGEVRGEIRCRGRLQVMPSGRLRGKVVTRTLVVNEGAIYEGELEMPTADESRRAGGSPNLTPVPIAAASEGRAGGGTTFIRRMGGPETAWEHQAGEPATADDGPASTEREA